MSDFNVSGLLELDASDYVTSARTAARTTDEFSESAEEAGESAGQMAEDTQEAEQGLLDINAAGIAAGGAMAGFGTATKRVLSDTKPMREELNRVAVNMDITNDAAHRMAEGISNSTFPMDDAVQTMSRLAEAGVENEGRMRELSTQFDLLADATGQSAAETARLAPILTALDGNFSAVEEDIDAFTVAANETNIQFRELVSTIERTDFTQLEEMGITAADSAALVAKFADETGYTGRILRSRWRQAVRDADGDLNKLLESLNMSREEFEEFREETASGTDRTEEYANRANEALDATDKMRAMIEDAKMTMSDYVKPVAAAGPALQQLGIATMALSTINISAFVPSLAAIKGAMVGLLGPIGLVAAAVGVLAAAWMADIGGIRDITKDVFGMVKQFVISTAIPAFESLRAVVVEDVFPAIESTVRGAMEFLETNAIGPFVDWVTKTWKKHGQDLINSAERAWNNITQMTQTAMNRLRPIIEPVLAAVETAIRTTLNFVASLWQSQFDSLLTIADAVFGSIVAVVDATTTTILETVDLFLDVLAGDWEGAWESITNIVDAQLSAIETIIGNAKTAIGAAIDLVVDTIKSPFVALYDFLVGSSLIPRMFNQIESVIRDTLNSIKSVFSAVLDTYISIWETAFESVKTVVETSIENVKVIVDTVTDNIVEIVDGFTDLLTGDFEGAWDSVENIVSNSMDAVERIIGNSTDAVREVAGDVAEAITDPLPSFGDMVDLGQDIVDGIISGLNNKLDPLRNAVDKVAGVIDSGLPGSDADRGPLSDYTDTTDRLGNMIVEGIEQAKPDVRAAMGSIAAEIDTRLGRMQKDIDTFVQNTSQDFVRWMQNQQKAKNAVGKNLDQLETDLNNNASQWNTWERNASEMAGSVTKSLDLLKQDGQLAFHALRKEGAKWKNTLANMETVTKDAVDNMTSKLRELQFSSGGPLAGGPTYNSGDGGTDIDGRDVIAEAFGLEGDTQIAQKSAEIAAIVRRADPAEGESKTWAAREKIRQQFRDQLADPAILEGDFARELANAAMGRDYTFDDILDPGPDHNGPDMYSDIPGVSYSDIVSTDKSEYEEFIDGGIVLDPSDSDDGDGNGGDDGSGGGSSGSGSDGGYTPFSPSSVARTIRSTVDTLRPSSMPLEESSVSVDGSAMPVETTEMPVETVTGTVDTIEPSGGDDGDDGGSEGVTIERIEVNTDRANAGRDVIDSIKREFKRESFRSQ